MRIFGPKLRFTTTLNDGLTYVVDPETKKYWKSRTPLVGYPEWCRYPYRSALGSFFNKPMFLWGYKLVKGEEIPTSEQQSKYYSR